MIFKEQSVNPILKCVTCSVEWSPAPVAVTQAGLGQPAWLRVPECSEDNWPHCQLDAVVRDAVNWAFPGEGQAGVDEYLGPSVLGAIAGTFARMRI